MVPAAQDLGLDAPVLLDPHRPLERQAVGGRLALARALARDLARAVQLVEVGEMAPVAPVARVELLVEDAELVDVDDVQVVVPGHRAQLLPVRVRVVVVVVKHDGGGPVAQEPLTVVRGPWVVLERHDAHGGALVVLGHVHRVVLELLDVVRICPFHVPLLLAPVVPVVRHVPQPDQVLLVEHDGALVVPATRGLVSTRTRGRGGAGTYLYDMPHTPCIESSYTLSSVWPHKVFPRFSPASPMMMPSM